MSFNPYHSTRKAPIKIAESLRMAILFPEAAMRVKRPAEPFIDVVMEENVSDYAVMLE
jgi:hypothetical protein